MDSAIDTLSTTSDHSVASSIESSTIRQNNNKRSSHSPYSNHTNVSNTVGGTNRDIITGINSNIHNNYNRPSSSIGTMQHHNSNSSSNNDRDSRDHLRDNTRDSSGGRDSRDHIKELEARSSAHHSSHHRRSLSPQAHSPPLGGLPMHRGGGGNGHPPSPPSSAAALSHQQMMQQIQHQLSPPHVSTPNSLAAQMGPRGIPHLPPHSLGLLNSLQMMHHASPLELMAAAHHHVPPRTYNSPPPISTSDPTANECKLVEYRGQKVAAFIISGETMLCLPQAFELFLKHLVGGLHTVYTKLKRLDIVPLVCNVEQVRILRGLGAIQPGVNRCKLLSCKDFDILYRDCTTARCLSIKPPESSRPGRPPKRGPVGLTLPPTHLAGHPQLKKHRLDNGDYAYENGHISDISRMDKSPLLANGYNPPPMNHMAFMQMNHHPGSPLLNPGMPPHGLHRPDSQMMKAAAAASGMSAANMDAIARSGIWENCRAAYEDIVKHLERLREERTDDGRPASVDQKPRDLSSRNGSPSHHSPVLNLSKSGMNQEISDVHLQSVDQEVDYCSDRSDVAHSPPPSIHPEDGHLTDDNVTDDGRNTKDEDLSDNGERDLSRHTVNSAILPIEQAASAHHRALNYSALAASTATTSAANIGPVSSLSSTSIAPPIEPANPESNNASSTETLLRNIQSLLKVAADNAKQQERQISYEKAELKMDVLREREVKDSLEKQLVQERKLRVIYQKRYRRERKIRVRLQRQVEGKPNTGSGDDKIGQDFDCKSTDKSDKISESPQRDHTTNRKSSESPSGDNNDGHLINNDNKNSNKESRNSNNNLILDRDNTTNNPSSDNNNKSDNGTGIGNNGSNGGGGGGGSNSNGSPHNSNKGWNYPGIDLMATGAFWQNYSESLAQEIEMERKARQQNSERDVKSPLQERQQSYYKNSVLFGSAT